MTQSFHELLNKQLNIKKRIIHRLVCTCTLMSTGLVNLGHYYQDLLRIYHFFIICTCTCTCRPGTVSQYMYLTDCIEIKLMCHYYEQQPTNKTHSYM